MRIFSAPTHKFNKNACIHDILSSTVSIKLNQIKSNEIKFAVTSVSRHFSGLETAWRGAI
jgi:hypothetical protein